MRSHYYCTQQLAPIVILSLFITLYLILLFSRTNLYKSSATPSMAPNLPQHRAFYGLISFRNKISLLVVIKYPQEGDRVGLCLGRQTAVTSSDKGRPGLRCPGASMQARPSLPSAPDIQPSTAGPLTQADR